MTQDLCPQCGSSYIEVPAPPPHHAQLECLGVDRHWGGYVKTPWSLERAQAFVMPFGKHRGETMQNILEADRSYVQWLALELDPGNAKTAAQIVLDGKAD